MKTRTTIKFVRNLTQDEYRQCYRKNLGADGSMRGDLMYCRRNPQGLDKVILIKAESEIIAWALVQFNLDAEGANVYFWVVPKYRRKGLGARLLYHSKKLDEKPYVFPHDRQSGEFFKKHLSDIRFAPYDGYWLTHTDESAIL